MLRVSMVSLTYANQAKLVLERLGYRPKIVHDVNPKGCVYVLSVDAPKSIVVDTLKKNHIPIRDWL